MARLPQWRIRLWPSWDQHEPPPPQPRCTRTSSPLSLVKVKGERSAVDAQDQEISIVEDRPTKIRTYLPPPPPEEPALAARIRVIMSAGPADSILAMRTGASLLEQILPSGVVLLISNETDQGIAEWSLLLDEGTTLDPHCVAWLLYAAKFTNGVASYADNDHAFNLTGQATIPREPCFFAAPHQLEIASCPEPPAVVLIRTEVAGEEFLHGSEARRSCLLAGFRSGVVAHVPFILSTVPGPRSFSYPGIRCWNERPDDEGSARSLSTLRVVIPTRDEFDMLDRMIRSMVETADRPDRVRICVVDNRSLSAEAPKRLIDLVRLGVEVIVADEPFNWSRLNNLAARGAVEDILVFANNDMEMLTAGWDTVLTTRLSAQDVGVVGARLLYPDGAIQHAGVLLGANDGMPLHDGLHQPGDEPGPMERWARARPAAALTGAFMAVKRLLFDEAGGFDDVALAVAYNDLDFCLRVREKGLVALYTPEITLTHFESHTRGATIGVEKRLWDDAEFDSFVRRWRKWSRFDPCLNPHHQGDKFGNGPGEGQTRPSLGEAMEWISCQTSRPVQER